MSLLPTVNIILRKDKEKDNKFPIILQVFHNGKRKQVFTGLDIGMKDFKDGKVINIKNRDSYNFIILKLKNRLEWCYINQAIKGKVDINVISDLNT